MKRLLFTFTYLIAFSMATFGQAKLAVGTWRGVLKMPAGTEVPFNFTVQTIAGKQQISIINSTERFKVTDVQTQQDSVFIKMPLFDSEFRLKLSSSNLEGKFIRHLGANDRAYDFTATPNTSWRFLKTPEKATQNITGRWQAVFGSGNNRDTTVGEFNQIGNKLTGTFLTTTGDYRYLEGTVSGNKLYLSTFDGAHIFLFTATIKDAQHLVDGTFGDDTWTAVKDAHAKLPDAYSLTTLKPGAKKIDFSFKDINGKTVSLSDARFKNKVVIVQFMGSWCPNCMDETQYLVNYYKKYHAKGVEVVGLAYERTTDFATSQRTLKQLKDRFKVPYPLLITGVIANKQEAAKSISTLNNFVAFPTTIIIDKKGDVAKIHTGYSGPGTGSHYTAFVKEFEELTDHLLGER